MFPPLPPFQRNIHHLGTRSQCHVEYPGNGQTEIIENRVSLDALGGEGGEASVDRRGDFGGKTGGRVVFGEQDFGAAAQIIGRRKRPHVEGARWQMLPAYVLTGLFFLVRLTLIDRSPTAIVCGAEQQQSASTEDVLCTKS